MSPYVYLGGAIVLEAMGTTALKSSDSFTRLVPTIITIACFAASFYLLSFALREVPTGVAYAIWSGVGIVLISAVAWIVHGQRIDPAGIGGIALIVAGVLVINLFSKTAAH